MDKYYIYKACEEYFVLDRKIVDSVYSLVLNLLGSIKNSKTNVGDDKTDLEKIKFFLSLTDKIKKMPDKIGKEYNSYFGIQVWQLKNLIDMIINKRTSEKTEIVGCDIKKLTIDNVVDIISTMKRMRYVEFINNKEKTNFHIDDLSLSFYLNGDDIEKRLYAANRIIELYSVSPEKYTAKDLKKARLIIEEEGVLND